MNSLQLYNEMLAFSSQGNKSASYASRIALEQLIGRQSLEHLNVAANHGALPQGLRNMIQREIDKQTGKAKRQSNTLPPDFLPSDQVLSPSMHDSLFKTVIRFVAQPGYEHGYQKTYYSKDYQSERRMFMDNWQTLDNFFSQIGYKIFMTGFNGQPFSGMVRAFKFFNELHHKGNLARFTIYANQIKKPGPIGDEWPMQIFNWERKENTLADNQNKNSHVPVQ